MEIFFLIASAIIIIGLIYGIYHLEKSGGSDWQKHADQKLKTLKSRYDSQDSQTMRSLVIEADALLDYCLKGKRLQGQTMGDRLKKAKQLFNKKQYNDVWEAHKMRNKLVHEINYNPNASALAQQYSVLRNAIEKLI